MSSNSEIKLLLEQNSIKSSVRCSPPRNLLLVASCSIKPNRAQTSPSSKAGCKFRHHLKRRNTRQKKNNHASTKNKCSLYSPAADSRQCWGGNKTAQGESRAGTRAYVEIRLQTPSICSREHELLLVTVPRGPIQTVGCREPWDKPGSPQLCKEHEAGSPDPAQGRMRRAGQAAAHPSYLHSMLLMFPCAATGLHHWGKKPILQPSTNMFGFKLSCCWL